jgi:hypothetical protein
MDWALNFWMGQDIDTPITVWQEMFLPSEVGKRIGDFTYTDASGLRWNLVSDVEFLYRSTGRRPVLDAPRTQWPYELAAGLAVCVLLAAVCFLRKKKPAAGRVLTGLCHSVLGLFFGAAGFLLYFLSFFTNHDYTWHNSNVLFAGPLLLAAVPLGLMYAFGKAEKRFVPELCLRIIWALSLLGVVLSMLIKLLPFFWQDNLTDQLLILPIALFFSLEPYGLKVIRGRLRKIGRGDHDRSAGRR